MATAVAPPASPPAIPAPTLTPVDRVSGVMFGLIMALTFTGSLSVATADRAEVRSMLIGALGCNTAWGLVDAVMFLLATLSERRRNLGVLNEVRRSQDSGRAHALILDAMPPVIAGAMEPTDVERIRGRLARLPATARVSLTLGDFRTALGVFLLVFLATLPVAIPFLFIPEPHRALRVSNGIALVMLFVGGYYVGRRSGGKPLWSGLGVLAIGVLLVWATIALGG